MVETGRGFQILRVESIEEARVISLEEARPLIAVEQIKQDKVEAVAADYARKVILAWSAAGAAPRELTDAKALPVVESGTFALGDEAVPLLADGPAAKELLAAVERAHAGDVLPDPLTVKGMVYAVQVTELRPPSESEFEAGARQVRARLEYTRKQAFFAAWLASVEKEAEVTRYLQGL